MIQRRTAHDILWAAFSGLWLATTLPLVLFGRSETVSGGWLEPLALIGLIPLLARLRGSSPRRAVWLGTLAGVAYFLLALGWLNVALTTFGHMPVVLSYFVLLLLICFLALFWGLPLLIAVGLRERAGLPLHWTLPPLWVVFEYLRNYALTGFPWASLGYTQVRTLWLAQLASIGGVYLVAFVVVFSNTVLEAMWAWWGGRAPLPRAAVVIWAVLLALGSVFAYCRLSGPSAPSEARRLKVGIVQGNLDERAGLQGQGAQLFVFSRMFREGERALSQGASLLVWPEGTLPQPVNPQIASFALQAGPAGLRLPIPATIIIGGVTRGLQDGEVVLTNSAFITDGTLRLLARYDKRHLVPFGEYVPLREVLPYRWFVPEGIAFFTPGSGHRPLETPAGRLGMLICYEAIFPEVARETVAGGAELLVNITNDSWYGFSSAPFQHLAISRLRAIETGRFLVRAANTGISAVIDPRGRVLGQTTLGLVPSDQERVEATELLPATHLVKSVALLSGGTVYLVVGDLFAWLCLLASAAMLGWMLVRRRRA